MVPLIAEASTLDSVAILLIAGILLFLRDVVKEKRAEKRAKQTLHAVTSGSQTATIAAQGAAVIARATYQAINGKGLTGMMRKLLARVKSSEDGNAARHRDNLQAIQDFGARLEAMEEAVFGKRETQVDAPEKPASSSDVIELLEGE